MEQLCYALADGGYRKIGARLPGPAKASAVVMKYLDGVIDQAISVRHHGESPEKNRQEHTLLGSLLARGMERHVSILTTPSLLYM